MSRTRETIIGACMLAAGLGYLTLTGDIPRRGTVDASFVPRMLAWIMIGLGALQTVQGLRLAAAVPEAAVSLRARLSPYAVIALTLALIAGFVALMRPLGFPVAAALFLFCQFWLMTPANRPPRPGLYAGLAVAASVIIFIAFRYGFDLLLPAGPLTRWLP